MPRATVHRNLVLPPKNAEALDALVDAVVEAEAEKPTAAKPETKKRRAKKDS